MIGEVDTDWQNQIQMVGETQCLRRRGSTPCICHALSAFGSIEAAAERITRYPRFEAHRVICVTITDEMGPIKQTLGPDHYSWWPQGFLTPPPPFTEVAE